MIKPFFLMLALGFTPVDDRPQVEDVNRIPNMEMCQGTLALCEQYLDWVQVMNPGNNMRWTEAEAEVRKSYYIWLKLTSINSVVASGIHGEGHIEEIRNELFELREMMGDADYYAGKFPPPIPLKYLQEIR